MRLYANLTAGRFPLGMVVMTQEVLALDNAGLDIVPYLARHAVCDWGEVPEDDWAANNAALTTDARLFSAYETAHGRLWIITEADRSVTTVLLPAEY